MKYEGGAIAVPTGPGLGVRLDREKLAEYHELFLRLGSYPVRPGPAAPGLDPARAERAVGGPADARVPEVPA